MSKKVNIVKDDNAIQNATASDLKMKLEHRSYSAPLPPPAFLQQYNEVYPDAAEKIFSMTENQANHRIELENDTIRTNNKAMLRGQLFGFIIALFGLSIAGLLGYIGRETSASIIGGGSLLGLVSAFIKGKSEQKKDINQKSDNK